jgi:methionine-rich copper-binding protein CopC
MLALAPQDAPDSIAAESMKLSAGEYTIRWQVLAADGHITRGEIPFVVQ